ncbi:MAG: glycosyltransferase family 4 protein, partial [Candidatus Subteraquimicrobiales bacterium]|nr:glycosyltransferase family 4 protein [Candidatus Subteraquimicrobiales bacterium]
LYNLENKNTILTVASLIFPYKGHDRVIKALPQVLKKLPNTVYLIVGDGPRRKSLENLVKELRLEENIIFTGFVASENLVKYYHACDVFIMPSSEDKSKGYVEGFGLVYLEANACGKPVIGGRCGGILDAIIDGITGLLVEPLNIDEIARALIKILEDRNYSKLLGENGRERAIREFNWEIIAEKTKEVYKGILSDSDVLSRP